MPSPTVILKAMILLLALFLLPVSMFGLCCVVTWQGVLLCASAGLLAAGPLLFWIGDERGSVLQMWLGKLMLAAAGVGATLVAWHAPDGHTAETAQIHSRFATGGWQYDRFSVGAMLPEIDQIHLGYAVASAFDPFFDQKQRRELAALTAAIYAEMGGAADFISCGSALPAIYRELTFSEFRDGHYFHYIPARVDRTKPAPALVFLHGSGGNFKAYAWLLSKVADELGITLIVPTFGLGNWEKRGAYESITHAIADAGKYAAIDPAQIHLMGLSNGGNGLCLAESADGPKFRSLIFLSAVWHNRIKPAELATRLQRRRVLVMSGGSDDRVPWNYVSGYTEEMQAGGLEVKTHRFDGEDHFLFFRQRVAVLKLVAEWLANATNADTPQPR